MAEGMAARRLDLNVEKHKQTRNKDGSLYRVYIYNKKTQNTAGNTRQSPITKS